MSRHSDEHHQSLQPLTMPLIRRGTRWVLALACVLALASTSACQERKSTAKGSESSESKGEGGQAEGGVAGTAAGGTGGATANSRPSQNHVAKAQRIVNQMNNYLIGIASAQGAPEDQEAAKQALKETNGLNWVPDPWGTPYIYKKTGDNSFELFSAGPDGAEGSDDDIRPQQ